MIIIQFLNKLSILYTAMMPTIEQVLNTYPKITVAPHMPWKCPITLELDLIPHQQEENHVKYWKPSIPLRESEVTDLRGECVQPSVY